MTTKFYLDLETGDAHKIHTAGPGFVRLAAYAVDEGPVQTTTDIDSIVNHINSADHVVGHNILAFDLPALERHHGLDLGRLVQNDRVIDTLLVARQNDPPLAGNADIRRYSLEALSRRVLGDGKLRVGGDSALADLAREYGGFDRIPVNDPTYLEYARQDVELVRSLARRLVLDAYALREHRVMWRLHHISKSGFRLDTERAQEIVRAQAARQERIKLELHRNYGLPLVGAKPQATAAGKKALERAFDECGVLPPRTVKGSLATGKGALDDVLAAHPNNPRLSELCGLLRTLNGERSTAQTLLDHVGCDGRVHPDIDARQATGRISLTKPGLSVLGKRDRENILERSLLLPDEGHVLISVDLSAIDARAMALHAQDSAYAAALAPGRDMHDEMAVALFGEDGWDRSEGHHPRRGEAKAITHATSYGMGASGLAQQTGMDPSDAAAQLLRLETTFPQLARFKALAREKARSQVITNLFGRRMRVHPDKVHTAGPAAMGQGTARDLMMEGILRLPEWLLPCLRAVIHDEIVLSVPEDRAEEAEDAVLSALQFIARPADGELAVPILAEKADRGRDWADCYRNEKPGWPEVSREHRDQPLCIHTDCAWHTNNTTEEIAA